MTAQFRRTESQDGQGLDVGFRTLPHTAPRRSMLPGPSLPDLDRNIRMQPRFIRIALSGKAADMIRLHDTRSVLKKGRAVTEGISVGQARSASELPSPPGPRNLPIIGIMHHFLKPVAVHIVARRLVRKYGDVTFMRLGSVPTVFLASPDVVREAFDKSEAGWPAAAGTRSSCCGGMTPIARRRRL